MHRLGYELLLKRNGGEAEVRRRDVRGKVEAQKKGELLKVGCYATPGLRFTCVGDVMIATASKLVTQVISTLLSTSTYLWASKIRYL